MLATIYCCRFGQRGGRAVFVVLSAARHRGFCSSAARPQTAEPSRTRQFFGMIGIGGASRPLPEREQERPRLLNAYPPLRRKSAACGAAASAPRALSLEPLPPGNYIGPHVSWQSPPHAQAGAGRNLMAAGTDDERSQGGRHVPNDAPTVPSSVLDQDIAGRQHHLRAIVELECHVAGEKDPEIRRVSLVKAVASSTGFVAILEVHLGSGFWCNHAGQVRPYDVADATYWWA